MYDYKKIFTNFWERPFVSMAIINEELIIVDANSGFARLSDKSIPKLTNVPLNNIFPSIFSLSQPDFINLLDPIKGYSYFENVTLWNGKFLSLEIAVIPMLPRTEKLLIIRDKTDYQFSYKKLLLQNNDLTTALENITDGVITTNKKEIIILANKSAEMILELSKDEILGKSIIDLFVLLNADSSTYAGKMEISTIFGMSYANKDVINDTVEIHLKNGQKKILLIVSTEISDSIDEFTGYLYVIKDITDQIRTETQLQISRKMESIGQLAAGIAHEINTPMQYIGDNVSFLKDAFNVLNEFCNSVKELTKVYPMDSDEIKKLGVQFDTPEIDYLLYEIPSAIDQTLVGLEKVNRIVHAMKNFAHPGYKEKCYSNINQAIQETSIIALNEYKYFADLNLDLEENLPPVYCHIDELNQVVLNMIVNSVHSIHDKIDANILERGNITINTRTNNNYVELKISDNGMGIKPEIIDKIFDPFYTTKEVGKGTGQGLSIAHNIIVRQHNGKIIVDSSPGLGTNFIISLPINPESNEKT